MPLNPMITLMGDKPDLMGGVFRANEQAFTQGQRNRENAFQRFQQQQGAALTRGDQGALDQFAQFDPTGAFNMRGAVDERARAEQARRAAAAAAAQNAQAARQEQISAADAERIERGLAFGENLMTSDPENWQQRMLAQFPDAMTELGIDSMDTFARMAPAIRARLGIDQVAQPAPRPITEVNGQLVYGDVPGDYRTTETPDPGFTQLTQDQILAMGLDPTKAYQVGSDNKVSQIGGSGVQVEVNTGDLTDEFYKTMDKNTADMFSATLDAGMQASSKIAQVDHLEFLLEQSPTGAKGAFISAAGEMGIPIEGLDNIQAAEALINKLVPESRQAGSGPMSDADLALFKQTWPRIINQPGGNKQIMDTVRAIALYDQARGEISIKVANRQLTPAEGLEQIYNLENPLQWTRADLPALEPSAAATPRFNESAEAQAIAEEYGLTMDQLWDSMADKDKTQW